MTGKWIVSNKRLTHVLNLKDLFLICENGWMLITHNNWLTRGQYVNWNVTKGGCSLCTSRQKSRTDACSSASSGSRSSCCPDQMRSWRQDAALWLVKSRGEAERTRAIYQNSTVDRSTWPSYRKCQNLSNGKNINKLIHKIKSFQIWNNR